MADKELDENDLVDMVNARNIRDSDPDEEESDPVAFTAKVIREGLELGQKLGNHFERALLFQRNINKCLTQYEELYEDLTKNQTQLLITDFITKVQRSEIASYSSNNESELHQILSSDESDIIVNRKKKRRVYEKRQTPPSGTIGSLLSRLPKNGKPFIASNASQDLMPNLSGLFGMYRVNLHLDFVGNKRPWKRYMLLVRTVLTVLNEFVPKFRNQSKFIGL
uniref:Uncharacterized protein n=1 Tax=Rhodnius prolixus TaxID=13249 RepID=T1HY07_RHOPR